MMPKKLIWRIYPSYLLITLISLGAVNWYASDAVREFFLTRAAADLEARARLAERQMLPLLSPPDVRAADALCKNMGDTVHTRITVILPSGKVIGDSGDDPDRMDNHADRPEMVIAMKGSVGISTRYSRTLDQNMMYAALPLKHDGNIIAVLRAATDVTVIDEQLTRIRNRIIFGGAIIALLAAWVSLFVSRRIARPIEEMKQGAAHFAEGDLGHRLHLPGSEEMEALARGMNRMAEQLDERIRTVVRQRNEIQAILSSMLEGVIALDSEEYILSMNEAAGRMFRLAPPLPVGKSIQEVVRNTGLHRFVKQAISGESASESDIVFYDNGRSRVFNVHSSPLSDHEGRRIGTLIVLNDVTRLRHLENMRRDFAANVSHEIRTPLTAIRGFVETLRDGAAMNQPEDAARFLDIIGKHADRLSAIIDDLINLSKIEREREEHKDIRFENRAIREVILSAVRDCQAKAEEKNIKIDLRCGEDVKARINPPLLEQAFANLLDNAVKYSESGSTVRISGSESGGETIIVFNDHGIGIAGEHLPRIFERFYRADKARSRKMGGTGLGLAIVKHIVQSHGGRVHAESTLGQGSAFSVHLPRG